MLKRETFQIKIQQFVKEFPGKDSYGSMRLDRIYSEVKDLDFSQFEKIMFSLINRNKFLPTIEEWCNEISIIREQIRESERKQERYEADHIMSTYSSDEKKWLMQTIIKRLNNQISDKEWNEFMWFISVTS